MTIKELEKKIKKQQKRITELESSSFMLTELINHSCELFDNHKKIIKSYCKNEEFNRKRIDNMEKCFDELLRSFAEGEYESENTIIH